MTSDECDCQECEIDTCDTCGGPCDRLEPDMTASCWRCRHNAEQTTDYEDWVAARRGKRAVRPDDGPEFDAYWEWRIDEAREGV